MQVYEIVVDGRLSAGVADSLAPMERRDVVDATILRLPRSDPDALARALALLESLGIGVTAVRVEGEDEPDAEPGQKPDPVPSGE